MEQVKPFHVRGETGSWPLAEIGCFHQTLIGMVRVKALILACARGTRSNEGLVWAQVHLYALWERATKSDQELLHFLGSASFVEHQFKSEGVALTER